jgi:hypothetical protein
VKSITLAVLIAVLFALLPFAARAMEQESAQDKFFHALRIVECGDVANPPDGDKDPKTGKYMAIGPYQIWEKYFDDAVKADESIRSLKYQDCRDPDKAAMVVGAYLQHYAPKSWAKQNWQVLARVHNGGPSGHRSKLTVKYWAKVEAAMKSLDQPPKKK